MCGTFLDQHFQWTTDSRQKSSSKTIESSWFFNFCTTENMLKSSIGMLAHLCLRINKRAFYILDFWFRVGRQFSTIERHSEVRSKWMRHLSSSMGRPKRILLILPITQDNPGSSLIPPIVRLNPTHTHTKSLFTKYWLPILIRHRDGFASIWVKAACRIIKQPTHIQIQNA